MTTISIVGGVYHERCIWPEWNQVYGSAGRAAAAITSQVDRVTLRAYSGDDTGQAFTQLAKLFGFEFEPISSNQTISFQYVHSQSVPIIRPAPTFIKKLPPITVKADVVLRFGMMESTAVVDTDTCIYDPQSAFRPEQFGANGSTARRLAVVANRGEILALGGSTSVNESAAAILKDGADVVIVKCGVEGALIIDKSGAFKVTPFRTDHVWTIGTGDVFAAVFASAWGIEKLDPTDAANLASKAVAEYVETMALPARSLSELRATVLPEATARTGTVYLASPFFSLGQRWVVDEARRCLIEFGMNVFSPVHDIGSGPAEIVAPADMEAIDKCDLVFAILDGLDPGTIFEIGYACARQKPVYVVAQTVSDEDMKMLKGSGCRIFSDFVTALHHAVWRT